MNTLNYFIEANIGIAVLYVVYCLVLGNETDFRVQRAYLLVGLFAAVLLPFLKIAGPAAITGAIPFTMILPELVLTASGTTAPESPALVLTMLTILLLIYLTGMTVILISMFLQGYNLFRVYHHCQKTKDGSHFIVESPADSSSYSFFNIVVIGQTGKLTPEERNMIILHEKCHGRLLHSVDVLIMTLLTILFWFNPVIWLYRRTILRVHEYQVDNVVSSESSSGEYSILLARTALVRNGFFLAHPFNQSFILKRINMINKLKSRIGGWKLMTLTITVLVLAVGVACTDQVSQSDESTASQEIPEQVRARLSVLKSQYPGVKFEVIKVDGVDTKPVWSTPGQGLVFLGVATEGGHWAIVRKKLSQEEALTIADESAFPIFGFEEYYKQLAQVLHYPDDARRKGIEGKVFVEFVVQEDGTLTDYKVLQGIDDECDAAALTAVMQLGDWNPGKQKGKAIRQRIVLPIVFALQQSKKEVQTRVDQTAAPAAGMTEFGHRLSQVLTYPDDARKKGIEGKVFVEFIVNEDGRLSDFKVVKGIDPECDAAAMNAMMQMEPWNPGMHEGKAVAQRLVWPIYFKLN